MLTIEGVKVGELGAQASPYLFPISMPVNLILLPLTLESHVFSAFS